MSEPSVVILDGVRTAIGAFGGSLAQVPARTLGAIVLREAMVRSRVAAEEVDEVVLGCVGQVGEDAYVSRAAAIDAGLPVRSTAYTVNRLCGSGLQALLTAALSLRAGETSVVAAGGVENMSRLPYYVRNRWGRRLGDWTLEDGVQRMLADPFAGYPMGETAEIVAERFGISRQAQDAIAWESHRRAREAIAQGRFESQIVPVPVSKGKATQTFCRDEHPRETSLEQLAALPPVFRPGGTVTAGNASGINDGAAALILTTEVHAARRGWEPRARLVSSAVVGLDPAIMGYGPTEAIALALQRAGLSPEALDRVELNEAFAAQVAAVMRDTRLDWARTNVNGGAIALGHPVGATGAILTVKLLYELERVRGRFGLVALCIGGGQGIAAVFENLRR
ncbi:MAG: thiolase family protein [Firmicutes bacterium]|nr:thiolase family protein [Alicyclobacillaceae bacterium]MCL6496953.1 thiolase family protein [Bacillota bacterium]